MAWTTGSSGLVGGQTGLGAGGSWVTGQKRLEGARNRDLRNKAALQWQQNWLGSNYPAQMGNQPMRRKDVPAWYLSEWYSARDKAAADRERALQQLQQSRLGYANDPRMQQAWQQYNQLMQSGGPYDAALREQLGATIRDKAGLGLQAQQQTSAEEMARRGLGGSLTGYQQAALGQQASTDLASQMANLNQWTTQANAAALEQARAAMAAQAEQQAGTLTGIDKAIADLFAQTEYGVPDLSILLQGVHGGQKYVGGGLGR